MLSPELITIEMQENRRATSEALTPNSPSSIDVFHSQQLSLALSLKRRDIVRCRRSTKAH